MNDQFDPAKPCRTRDGREVRIYATDGGGDYAIHGSAQCGDGTWIPESWTLRGEHLDGSKQPRDLVNVTPDVVKYANLYGDGCIGYETEDRSQLAENRSKKNVPVAVLKITIRDGREVSVEVERV